jgi:hypothetical protein
MTLRDMLWVIAFFATHMIVVMPIAFVVWRPDSVEPASVAIVALLTLILQIGAVVVIGVGYFVCVELFHAFFNYPLTCRRKSCARRSHRQYVDTTPGGFILRCQCGDEYHYTGDRFTQILPAGSERPHLKCLSRSGRWVRDESDSPCNNDTSLA